MKKYLITVFALVLAFCLVACSSKEKVSDELTYVEIDTGAKVGLFLNSNSEVVNYVSLNEEGDAIVNNEDLEGESLEDAIDDIIDGSIETGLIDSEGENDVTVIVPSEDDETVPDNNETEGDTTDPVEEPNEDTIKGHCKKHINKYFRNHGIFGRVSEETLTTYGEAVDALEVSNGTKKMILLALELNSDLTLDDVKDLSKEELVKICNVAIENRLYEVREAYKQAKEAIKEEYKDMFTLAEEIEALEESLESEELTEEEIAAINEELEAKKAEYQELKKEYKEDMNEAKEEYKESKAEIIKEKKNKCSKQYKELKEEHKEKNDHHKKYFDESSEVEQEEIKEDIKQYQNKKGKR